MNLILKRAKTRLNINNCVPTFERTRYISLTKMGPPNVFTIILFLLEGREGIAWELPDYKILFIPHKLRLMVTEIKHF